MAVERAGLCLVGEQPLPVVAIREKGKFSCPAFIFHAASGLRKAPKSNLLTGLRFLNQKPSARELVKADVALKLGAPGCIDVRALKLGPKAIKPIS